MNNNCAKFEYKGMKTFRVTDYTNQTPPMYFGWKKCLCSTPVKNVKIFSNNKVRVCATGRHCRQMRQNNLFCTKNINLATTIGERKIASEHFWLVSESHLRLQVIASCRLMVINVYLNCQLTPQLSTTQFSSWSGQTWTRAGNLRRSAHTFNSCYR